MAYVQPDDLLNNASKQDIFEVAVDERDARIEDFKLADSGTVQAAIRRAEATVNSYVGGTYELPLSKGAVTPALKDAVLVLAKYKLFARRNFIDDSLQRERKAAIEWLRGIQTGANELFTPDGEEATEGGDRFHTATGFATTDAATFRDLTFQD